MTGTTVSVVVTLHDYERYVGAAIESALAQDPAPLEVIVVDDGSTDGSATVVKELGDRVRLVSQPNGGQGSACNTGMEHVHGDVVIFLDADDVLRPGIVGRVAQVFAAEPDVVKVHWRLEIIDAAGRGTGQVQPPVGLLDDGDLRDVMLSTRNYATQPMSANAFRADVLRAVLPMPEPEYRVAADAYLNETVPLFGRVRALDDVGVGYRVHGGNDSLSRGSLDGWARWKIALSVEGDAAIRRLAPAAGLDPARCPPLAELPDPALCTARLVSLLLAPDQHPFPGDRRHRAAAVGVRGLGALRTMSMPGRARRAAWFAAAGFAPRPVARRVVQAWTPDGPAYLAEG